MAQKASLCFDPIGDHTGVFTLDGTCDLDTSVDVEERIIAALQAGRTEIVCDLRGVSSVSPSLLHVLFRALLQTKGRSGRFVLVQPNAALWDTFERAGLDRVFPVSSDLKGALAKEQAVGARARALERVGSASTERSRKRMQHKQAKGTSDELQAAMSLRAANDELVARRRWLQWVEDGDY
jgi:anti-anti-sigma factor